MERGTWSARSPYVQKALKFVKRTAGKGDLPNLLVDWDRRNGRKLLTWDNSAASEQWRVYEARLFLNTFRLVTPKFRVRAYISVPANALSGLEERAYLDVESISESPGLRAAVIQDITRRMKSLAAELRMWKLDEAEQRNLFAELRQAMEPETNNKAA